MRLAEAAYMADCRRQRPILLLDDVLSELDADRRAHVLDRATSYEQCFISTTDGDSVGARHTPQVRRLEVRAGSVAPSPDPG
jgi:DNA replication and repair protein RecF